MAGYRVPEFTLEQRTEAALQMLVPRPERSWGMVSALAERYGVSRTSLYALRDEVGRAIEAALQPDEAGRPGQVNTLRVDQGCIDRAIALWPMLSGSVRGIQVGLALLLGVSRSVGYISQKLTTAGRQAAAYNREMRVPLPILGEADEIFQGRKPCLTLVDGRSFLVLNLTPAEARDGTTWGVTYLDLMARGIEFQDLACDGGSGLRAGVRAAQLAVPLRPDLFHLLQTAHRLSRRLEGMAYRAIETAERARRADLEERGLRRRRGRRLTLKVPLPQAELEEAQALEIFDTWRWLLAEIRQALEPITPTHRLAAVAQSQATLETALALLRQLGQADLTAFAADLQEKLPDLLAPLLWLEHQLAPHFKNLTADTQAFLLWAWQQRHLLALNLETDLPQALRSVGPAIWKTLGLFHRSSSLAESLHSWLRPHLQSHRGMPQWLLPLLQLFWNHHRFERGQRAGHSPLELAGVTEVPSLTQVLDQLFRPEATAQPG
jgi:hypothetical protein